MGKDTMVRRGRFSGPKGRRFKYCHIDSYPSDLRDLEDFLYPEMRIANLNMLSKSDPAGTLHFRRCR